MNFFPKEYRRLGATFVALELHDSRSGKWDRQGAWYGYDEKPVRSPLTWTMLAEWRQTVVSMEDGGYVIWLGLAVL